MKTLDEEILLLLGTLNAMSKRGRNFQSPQEQQNPQCGSENTPPRGHGRGRLLGFLADNGEMSQSQIAAHLDIRPQSLSELLCKAECDGFIQRRQSDEDKRQILVSLTDCGRSRVADFRENHRKRAAEFLYPLTDEEKETFALILRKLVEDKRETP